MNNSKNIATKEELRAEWIRRLRSGEYKQGKFALRKNNDKYCCLGVACIVYSDLVEELHWETDHLGRYCFIDRDAKESVTGTLLSKVAKAFGMKPSGRPKNSKVAGLISLNDDEELSFLEIADRLEIGDYWIDEKTT
jgi:hypothetical protein